MRDPASTGHAKCSLMTSYREGMPVSFCQIEIDRHKHKCSCGEHWAEVAVEFWTTISRLRAVLDDLNASYVTCITPGDLYQDEPGEWLPGVAFWIKLSRPVAVAHLREALNGFLYAYEIKAEHCFDKENHLVRLPGQYCTDLAEIDTEQRLITPYPVEHPVDTLLHFSRAWHALPGTDPDVLACVPDEDDQLLSNVKQHDVEETTSIDLQLDDGSMSIADTRHTVRSSRRSYVKRGITRHHDLPIPLCLSTMPLAELSGLPNTYTALIESRELTRVLHLYIGDKSKLEQMVEDLLSTCTFLKTSKSPLQFRSWLRGHVKRYLKTYRASMRISDDQLRKDCDRISYCLNLDLDALQVVIKEEFNCTDQEVDFILKLYKTLPETLGRLPQSILHELAGSRRQWEMSSKRRRSLRRALLEDKRVLAVLDPHDLPRKRGGLGKCTQYGLSTSVVEAVRAREKDGRE